MTQQTQLWTALPNGRVEDGADAGRLRISIVVSPRLTPQAPKEQVLKAFRDWRNWPKTLDGIKLVLRIDGQRVELQPLNAADPALWERLLPADTPVAGFVFKDMSQVNLRSYSVPGVLGLVRQHYGRLAVQATNSHPTLLPWKDAHPDLKGMLTDLGTRSQFIGLADRKLEVLLPGFGRFHDNDAREPIEQALRDGVFGNDSPYTAPVPPIDGGPKAANNVRLHVLPQNWQDPSRPDAWLMAHFSSQAEYTLYQADRFYRRQPLTPAQQAQRRPDRQGVPAAPSAPQLDFHQITASYSDYPLLLRRLGLVIDCLLPLDNPIDKALAANKTASGVMAVELHWDDGAHDPAEDSCPATAWAIDRRRFFTRPRTADHLRGMLDLRHADDRWTAKDSRSPFDLYQLDPDGTALKTVNFLLTAQNLVGKSLEPGADGRVTYTTGDKQPVAALRSGGLGVSRRDRATQVAVNAAAAALKDKALASGAASKILLFAEDVLRGYRVDVQTLLGDEPWHSLCARQGDYRFSDTGEPLDLAADEGYIKGASTTRTPEPEAANSNEDHYLHESLFRWSGWSLVAPRPGRTLLAGEEASGVQSETPQSVDATLSSGGNGLSVNFKPTKGSLPRLRFGMAYRLRVRAVDLAGNSLSADERSLRDDDNISEPVTYWRFEPVDPPVLMQRVRLSEGESLERLVLRSNFDVDCEAYLATPAFAAAIDQPASAAFEYTATNQRHVAPPKTSQLQCESHGVFDDMLGAPGDIKKAYAIAAREAGTLYDSPAGAVVELVTPSALEGVATTVQVPPRLPSTDNPSGDRLAPGQYVIHREAKLLTPYLPDPAAAGLALCAEPGHALPGVTSPLVLGPGVEVTLTAKGDPVLLVRYANGWPDSQGLRIILAERPARLDDPPCLETFDNDGAPNWDAEQRTLTLFVAKGRIVRLRYSSFVDKATLPIFGLPAWTNSQGEADLVRHMAEVGCAWMITPFRSLVLVHATQQPVCLPQFLTLQPQRQLGDHHARLSARLGLHGPSTGKLEVQAHWQEWVDDPSRPAPVLQDGHGALGEVMLAENHANLFSLENAVAEQMHDPVARPRSRGDVHEFGDSKFRLIQYRLVASSRFREYLPPTLFAQRELITRVGPVASGPLLATGADDDPGAPVLVAAGEALNTLVPASAPPTEPRLLYVIPTLQWQTTATATALDSTRLGNGLRVWLERPWFSSGNGELLGVILLGENQPFTDIPDRLTPLVSQWGLDPLWDTTLPKHRARASDFGARVFDEDVSLQEMPGQRVHVVGHRVQWDGERGKWYCDISLDAGLGYMPFVRLALVRYQPNALEQAKVSKVVLADFAQLLPRRRAQFQRSATGIAISLRGTVPAAGPMQFPTDSPYQEISFRPLPNQVPERGRNKLELVLQTRDPQLDSDLAWQDQQILASSILDPAPGRVVFNPATVRPVGIAGGPVLIDLDPAIWNVTTPVPTTDGRPARLVLREYERYYTDRFKPELRANAVRKRRVVEERLVYTVFFDL
jgi:hypothetical protein